MNKERKNEIGYLILVNRLRQEGILFNTSFKEQLDSASSALGIHADEMKDFTVLLTVDVVEG